MAAERRAGAGMPLVLVACECSGEVREAFRRRGIDALSVDMQEADDGSPFHVQGDMFEAYEKYKDSVVLVIAHPPCTYLSSSGLHWNTRVEGRAEKTREAIEFVKRIFALPVPMLCVENPVGCISTRIAKATQYVQPYEFGDDASKKTGLWLRGLPPLEPTAFVEPRTTASGKKRWANQTDSGQNKLAPSATRAKDRSKTYRGIAEAMAAQWAPLVAPTPHFYVAQP